VRLLEKEKQNGKATSNSASPFPRTGEIAIFANFTKSASSFPPYFFCLFNLLRMVRLLHLKLLRETLRTVSKPTIQLCSRFSEGVINMLNTILGARLLSWHFANGWVFEPAIEKGTASTATLANRSPFKRLNSDL